MADTNFDDGMTEAERNYFATGGDVNDALSAENRALANGGAVPSGEQPFTPAPASPTAPAAGEPPPAAVAATPAPAPIDEPDPGDEPSAVPGKPPRRVSYRKFEATQQALAERDRQLQEQAVRNARVEERLSLLQQALASEPAAAEQPKPARVRPDPTTDIFGYAQYLEEMVNDLRAAHDEVSGKVNDYEQQITVGQAEMESERRYLDSLNSYAGKQPNFVNAYNFLLRNRAAELMAPRYPAASFDDLMRAEIPQDIADMLRQEERDLYRTEFEARRSPAETIFRMAQLRGYRLPAPASANGTGTGAPNAAAQRPGTPLGAPPANGGAHAPVAAPAPATPAVAAPAANGAAPIASGPTAAQIVESIQRGQPAAMSLSNASGGTGIELTPQVLADMPQDQFEALFNELQARGDKQKLMDLMGH